MNPSTPVLTADAYTSPPPALEEETPASLSAAAWSGQSDTPTAAVVDADNSNETPTMTVTNRTPPSSTTEAPSAAGVTVHDSNPAAGTTRAWLCRLRRSVGSMAKFAVDVAWGCASHLGAGRRWGAGRRERRQISKDRSAVADLHVDPDSPSRGIRPDPNGLGSSNLEVASPVSGGVVVRGRPNDRGGFGDLGACRCCRQGCGRGGGDVVSFTLHHDAFGLEYHPRRRAV